jgi:hypothetical protein
MLPVMTTWSFEEEVYDLVLPNRDVYVKEVVKTHKQTMSNTHCFCGVEYKGHFYEHIADIVLEASDAWDQLCMGEVNR